MTHILKGVRQLDRRDAVATLLARRGDALVIAGVGSSVWDCAAAGDTPRNFYLWNAMGSAAMVGLGLALAQPETPVLVITGDGDLMMQLGCLATIAAEAPSNLRLIIMDNGVYHETGGQPTHNGLGASVSAVAEACGFPEAFDVSTTQDLATLAERVGVCDGLLLAALKIADKKHERVMPPRNGAYLATRFREALLGPAAHA